MRKRVIKKIGGSYFIHLTPYDLKDMEREVGDEIDIECLVILNNLKK